MKTRKLPTAKKRETLAARIRRAPDDLRKSLLAEYDTCDYRSEELWEVFRIIERQSLLARGTVGSSGGPEAEATLAAKCLNAVKKHDADFFLRLAKEVRRQSERRFVDPFHLHLLMLKKLTRWRVKSGLPEFTLRQVKSNPDKPETKLDVLVPSEFENYSDRHWHREAAVVGLPLLPGNGGRPKTRNK